MSINKVIATGNLTRDPELRVTATGTPVMSFGIAINERRRNPQTQEWEDYPNFIDCTMFGARAEAVSKYLSKGSKVAIAGKLHWSQWERDGKKHSKIEIFVEEIEFMSGNKNQTQNAPTQLPPTQQVTVHNVAPQNAYQQAPQSAPLPQSQTPAYMAALQPAQVASQVTQMPTQQQPLQNSIYDEDIPF